MQFVLWAKHIKDDLWVDISHPTTRDRCYIKMDLKMNEDPEGDWEYEIHVDGVDPNGYEPNVRDEW